MRAGFSRAAQPFGEATALKRVAALVLREQLNLTWQEVADTLGVSEPTVRNWAKDFPAPDRQKLKDEAQAYLFELKQYLRERFAGLLARLQAKALKAANLLADRLAEKLARDEIPPSELVKLARNMPILLGTVSDKFLVMSGFIDTRKDAQQAVNIRISFAGRDLSGVQMPARMPPDVRPARAAAVGNESGKS